MALPQLGQTVLDAVDARAEAEFWRQFLGLVYRADSEIPPDEEDVADWLVLLRPDGSRSLAVQQVATLTRSTWPDPAVPQQLHLDCTVPDRAELERQRARAQGLGATLLHHRSADSQEPLYVLADPAGHPFCLFVAPNG